MPPMAAQLDGVLLEQGDIQGHLENTLEASMTPNWLGKNDQVPPKETGGLAKPESPQCCF